MDDTVSRKALMEYLEELSGQFIYDNNRGPVICGIFCTLFSYVRKMPSAETTEKGE